MNMNKAIAHVKEDAAQANGYALHYLEEHLEAVAELSADFAESFGSSDWARVAGIWHDLGKYSKAFQSYIKKVSGYDTEAHIETVKGRVDHSSAGAQLAVEKFDVTGRILAYLIAGHHAGLPDWYKLDLEVKGGVLSERLKDTKHLNNIITQTISSEILEQTQPQLTIPGGREGFALWVRMLFSCLVDADFLDTEAFMNAGRSQQRGGYPAIHELLQSFNIYMQYLTGNAQKSKVNRIRNKILQSCRNVATEQPSVFSLSVPTGGGKTLSSMAFALEHAVKYDKQRIIYVIPYTSIIEQTVNIFREIFTDAIIEHHSNLDPDEEDSKSRLATENWDAPIIVTTSVQFFESLFAARTSKCRKLHNIINSIVVLDEVQLLPPEYLQPIINVMNLLTEYYGVIFVLSTATQPALATRKDGFERTIFKGIDNVHEIILDPDQLVLELERVHIQLPSDLHLSKSWNEIATELLQYETVLVIVNTRQTARDLYALMPKGTIHLSALMCGQHRSDVINKIKQSLKDGIPTRVVSTQLVEAGVDFDFPVVYRALSGLDSIAQAAGRCNREGRLEKGEVVVFVPEQSRLPGLIKTATQTSISLLSASGGNPLARERFREYFEHFYTRTSSLDKNDITDLLKPDEGLEVQFRTAAAKFKMIDEYGQNIFVKYNEASRKWIDTLQKKGPERWLMRKLQRHSVTISDWQFKKLLERGEVDEVRQGMYTQVSDALYDENIGLLFEDDILQPKTLMI